jgi:hypothetical protein
VDLMPYNDYTVLCVHIRDSYFLGEICVLRLVTCSSCK